MEVRDFEFGFDVHLVFNIRTHLVFLRLPILADEDEAGQKDRFQRDDHRQETEGERIEASRPIRIFGKDDGVERNPGDKPDCMNKQERHTAAEPGEQIGNLLQRAEIFLYLFVGVTRNARAQ